MEKIHEEASVHINDTYLVVVPAELTCLLVDEYRPGWDVAWGATIETMSYTNHTILVEALERWDAELFKKVLPHVYQVILEIDNRFVSGMASDGVAPQIIENIHIVEDGLIHTASLAIIGGYSVNGAAKLRTELLKKDTLRDFYNLYSEKSNNKTSGIVQRRWVQITDQPLSKAAGKWTGSGWRSDIHELCELNDSVDSPEVLSDFYRAKQEVKARLAVYIKETTGIGVSTDATFDVQAKRLHAYERQLLDVLNIIKQYQDLKDNPDKDIIPHVYIFGAKAAPGYHFVKSVIKAINELANLINNGSSLNGKPKVVFLENYNVGLAELIIPAINVSEQIPLASKEASGTSSMKFMMAGATALATLDGANIEIEDEVGSDSIVIFGMDKNDVYRHYECHDYYSRSIYGSNPIIRHVVDSFINGIIPNIQGEGTEIYESLITHNDEYFSLEDFIAYVEAQEKIDQLYRSQEQWMYMSLINIANSDKLTSDDTIIQYAKEIWQLKN